MKYAKPLPEPECPMGYPVTQLQTFITDMDDLNRWLDGQTMALCEGRRWSYANSEWEPDECAGNPHGAVVYRRDVRRYLDRLPVVD